MVLIMQLNQEERVAAVNRVTKVVKGGRRRLSFRSALVALVTTTVAQIKNGKAQEVPEAIRKAVEDAKKNLD